MIDLRTCDPNALPASSSFDALIHEQFLGRCVHSWVIEAYEPLTMAARHRCQKCDVSYTLSQSPLPVPQYSTNPAHAGELRRMAEQSTVCHGVHQVSAVVAIGIEVGSAAVLYTEGDKDKAEALAICRAFAAMLKAKAEGSE